MMFTRLYFDLVNTHESLPDREGVEVDDIRQAKAVVRAMVDELRHEDASAAQAWSGWTLNVSDDAGHVLFAIDLSAGARSVPAGKRPRRVRGSDGVRPDAER